jgi:hypothetical protein
MNTTTSATVTSRIKQEGSHYPEFTYRNQDGEVIRKSFNRYYFTNGINFSRKPKQGFVAITEVHPPTFNEGGQLLKDLAEKETRERMGRSNKGSVVVDSPAQAEANPGQSKENAVSTTEVAPLVIDWTEGVVGVPADKDGNGFVAAVPGTCRCGCGQEVGKGSKFRPGHDAKYKGMLQRAAIAGQMVVVNKATGIPALDASYTDEFDYRENVQRALDKAASKGASAEDKAKTAAEKKAVRDAEKADEKAKRDAKRAEDKATRDAEKAARAEAKRQAALAKAEADDAAKTA